MLDGLFKPRAVAVIGASNNPFSIGHIVIKNLAEYGFKGPIFPINPKGGSIRSFQAYKSMLDVPGRDRPGEHLGEGQATCPRSSRSAARRA